VDDASRNQALEVARSLEKRGQTDPAVRAFLRVGAIDEAARVLVTAKRFADAGDLLVQSLGVPASDVGALDPESRKLALRAAICFSQAGDVKRAVELLVALGDLPRAIELLQRSGDSVGAARLTALSQRKGGAAQAQAQVAASAQGMPPPSLDRAKRLEQEGKLEPALAAYVELRAFSHAGRVARKLGRPVEAAQMFVDATMPFEAAVCFSEASDPRQALQWLSRVPRDDERYRKASIHAIRLATELNEIDFQLDQFLTRFVGTGPQDARELEAFYVLARLLETHDFPESARDVYAKIVEANGSFRDAAERLAAIDADARGAKGAYERILKQDQGFYADRPPPRSKQLSRPDDDLPPLPPLPDVAPRAVARTELFSGPRAPVAAPSAPTERPAPIPRASRAPTRAIEPPTVRNSMPDAPTEPPPSGVTEAPPNATMASEQNSTLAEPAPGLVINKRYEILQKIGQGGMAIVFRAADLELGEEIAIKVFTQSVDDPALLSRFKQELSVTRQLSHPNIVRLHDIGSYGPYRFITMELLSGSDLAHVVSKGIDMILALRYLVQACAGLSYAHEKGIVHRDIKPENFFVTKDNVLKVMDFGIAKRQATKGLTVAGFIAGTPAYMSPEQISNFASVTPLTDLYALGVVAYELLTGTIPFEHEEMMPLLMMHLTHPPDPPKNRNPRIPDDLNTLVLRLLEKDPAKRVANCRELAQQLSVIGKRLAAGGGLTGKPSSSRYSADPPPGRRTRRTRAWSSRSLESALRRAAD
jgi:eukaryotic-like serine/threonine-protein kinase